MSFRNSFLVLLFGGTLGMFLLREQQREALEWFDSVHREFLKANPAPGEAAPALAAPAIIFGRLDDVDQKNRIFETWPLGQGDWQVILQNLSGYQPKTVAVAATLPFDKAGSGLEGASKTIPRLITAAAVSVATGDGGQTLPEGLPVLQVSGPVSRIPAFKSIRSPAIPGVPGAGDIDMQPREQDLSIEGDWCRVPMLARIGDKVVPALALRALMEWAAVPADKVTVRPGKAIIAGPSLRIPIDDSGFFRYYVSLAPEVPSLNADVFALTREQAQNSIPPHDRAILAALPQSLLWIGHDNVAKRVLKDPNGTLRSPAYLTARALAAIQTARYMRPLPPSHHWIAPAATLLFCLWLTHWRKSRLWPGAFIAAVALAAVSLYFYRSDDLWIPLVPSLAILAATLVLSCLLPARPTRRSLDAATPDRRTRTAPLPVAPTGPPPPHASVIESITELAAAPPSAETAAAPEVPTNNTGPPQAGRKRKKKRGR